MNRRTPLAAACLLLAAGTAAAATRDFSKRLTANAVDLPGRCPSDLSYKGYGLDITHESDGAPTPEKFGKALQRIFVLEDATPIRDFGYFSIATNYYEHRAEVQAKARELMDQMTGKDWLRAESNYVGLLFFLGEYQKIIAEYGAKAPRRREYAQDGRIEFYVGQALFRLGRYAEALPFAVHARQLLPKNELDTVWMLMTVELGLYGHDIYTKHSKEYTLDNVKKLFPVDDDSQFPFEDATDDQHIRRWGNTGGVAWADFDGDGWDELLFTPKFFYPQLYKNDHGHLKLEPSEKLGNNQCTALTATVTDYDNDGKLDIYRSCCNFDGPGPAIMHHNKGRLTFEDVTKEVHLDYKGVSAMHNSWADYDLDGNLDLAVADMFGPTRLFHNNGDGTFTEVTEKAGIHTPPYNGGHGGLSNEDFGAVSTVFGDLDGDGWPDLFTQGWGWKKIYHNNHDGTFTDVTEKSGMESGVGKKGYVSFFFDYNNDGLMDIFVGQYVTTSDEKWGYGPACTCSNLLKPSGYSHHDWVSAGTIYRNNGDGTFTNMGEKTHFIPFGIMGATHGDWNNDGYEDIIMGSGGPISQQVEPMLFYQNNGDGTFTNITRFTDFALWGKGHGAAFADYDHDGNLDLFVNSGGVSIGDAWPSTLFHNLGNSNHWLEVSLRGGKGTNRFAIGAQVRLFAGQMQQLKELSSGGNFSGTNTLRLHFGLAQHEVIDRLEVTWPNRNHDKTVLTNVPVDQAIEIYEGAGAYKTLWKAPHGALAKTETDRKKTKSRP